MTVKRTKALIILDGFGIREESFGNAVKQAYTPNFDAYWNTYPHAHMRASGEAVGLPEGQMGNSEVGHLNIGAGRIVYQSLTRIQVAIENGTYFKNNAFVQAMIQAQKSGKAVHLLGLLSDGGVHSHINHLIALLELAKELELTKVYVHPFLDGRDVGPKTARTYIEQLEAEMKRIGVGEIATISGRYFAMDRDQRWERVQKAYDAIMSGTGPVFHSPLETIEKAYDAHIYDEFIVPSVMIDKDNQPIGHVEEGDSVIFYNFRPDRARQLSEAITNPNFEGFHRGTSGEKIYPFVMMMHYSNQVIGEVAFQPVELKQTIGEVLASENRTQLRIAETEKYPHVTYFMNGGREEPFPGEKRVLIASPKVATYDLQPEMSAYELTDRLIDQLDENIHDTFILNFANPDMVGHSGMLEPTIKAIEAVDICLGRIIEKLISIGGEAIITADHGNADEVRTIEDQPMTAHTTNEVPVIVVTKKDFLLRNDGILADLAPTLLELLEIQQPQEMTGRSLVKK